MSSMGQLQSCQGRSIRGCRAEDFGVRACRASAFFEKVSSFMIRCFFSGRSDSPAGNWLNTRWLNWGEGVLILQTHPSIHQTLIQCLMMSCSLLMDREWLGDRWVWLGSLMSEGRLGRAAQCGMGRMGKVWPTLK